MDNGLASERVVVEAPMSFVGSAKRAWRLRAGLAGWVVVPAVIGVLALILLWWTADLLWYSVFGLLLVPYRLVRRGGRRRKAEELRHRETLEAIRRQSGQS